MMKRPFRMLSAAFALPLISCLLSFINIHCASNEADQNASETNRSNDTAEHVIKHGTGATEGMVWIPAGEYFMGADNEQANQDEYPKHKVINDGFWMDETEVTNAHFARFVKATGYVTTAEQVPDVYKVKKSKSQRSKKGRSLSIELFDNSALDLSTSN